MQYGNRFSSITPVVLNLIIINTLVFFAQMVFEKTLEPGWIPDHFAQHHYKSDVFKPHQLITRMFMHAGFLHLFFNMLGLFFVGTSLERIWGSKRFLVFFLLCGIGAGLFQMGNYAYQFWEIDHSKLTLAEEINYQSILRLYYTLGASGAIMGLLAGFAYLFPNTEVMIIPIPFPIKVKWVVLGIIALDLFSGISGNSGRDHIAHFSHLGGAISGFLITFYWNKTNKKTFY